MLITSIGDPTIKCYLHNILIDGLVWCGLLWCLYQLFGLSFWRHPFTAEDSLVSKWWNATFLQTSWGNKLTTSWPEGGQRVYFWVNYSFNPVVPGPVCSWRSTVPSYKVQLKHNLTNWLWYWEAHDKQTDVFDQGWNLLIGRFMNSIGPIKNSEFPKSADWLWLSASSID